MAPNLNKELAPAPSHSKGIMGAMMASGGDYPERIGHPVCQYYKKTGMCKFGASCKYHHPSQGGGSSMPTTLNIYGYPLRTGEKECSYYVRTGLCKFGVICKFHHPQPACVQVAAPMPGPALGLGPMPAPAAGIYPNVQPNQEYGVPSGNRPVARPTMLPGSYVPCTYGTMVRLPQGTVSVPGWSFYPALVSSSSSASTQPNVGASPFYGVTQLSPQAPAYTGQYVPVSSFPAPSGSSPMSDIFADLPQEVISDILLRLPAKSIGRFRCVSKPWLSLLTSYQFIRAHLTHHSLAQQQKLLIISSTSSRPRSLSSLTLHLAGNQLKELSFFKESALTLLGSCNGLVFVDTELRDKYVINCLTEEYVKLPYSPIALCPHPSISKYGFGYDSLNDDYKIVSVSQCDNESMTLVYEISCADNFVDIYSLKMRSWKRFGTSPYGHDIQCDFYYYSCLFVNGAIHWLAWKSSAKESLVIVAFDLSSEEFKEIPAPASENNAELIVFGKLKVIDECLGIVVGGYEASKIWLMKSYLVVESWTKLAIQHKPLCFHKDKILFQDFWRDQNYKWYFLKDGRVEVCLDRDDVHELSDGISYSESLISPHFNHRNRKEKGEALNLAAIGRK